MNFTLGLLLGALAAALGALPAALRAAESGVVWLALGGAAALVAGPALGGVIRARPLSVAVWSVLVGLGVSALPLAVFAHRLRIGTHHRPLGAVTFVIGAAVVIAVCVVVAARVLSLVGTRGANAPSQRGMWVRRALAAAALVGPVVCVLVAATTEPGRRGAFDVALCLGLSALSLLVPLPARAAAVGSKWGLPVWLGFVALGIWAAAGPARVAAEVASPALFAPVGWMLR